MRYPEFGEAFGVRRPGAAFPALHFKNDPLKSSDTFPDSKAGKAARLSPHSKGFADSKWLIQCAPAYCFVNLKKSFQQRLELVQYKLRRRIAQGGSRMIMNFHEHSVDPASHTCASEMFDVFTLPAGSVS